MRISSVLALSLSLSAALSACATAGDEDPADGASGEAVAERGDALTMAAGMEWSGSPHDLLPFIPGADVDASVEDASPSGHEVYQVLVNPQPNSTGTLYVSNTWSVAHSACPLRSLSVRAFAISADGGSWYEVKKVDLTSSPSTTGGEFPSDRCLASTSINVTPSMGKIRVMAQARTRSGIGPALSYSYQSAKVSGTMASPAPDLSANLTLDANASASAVIVNEGPVTADSVDADITYAYDYCPPKQGNENTYCLGKTLALNQCIGPYCGEGTYGTLRQPIRCSWSKDFDNVQVNANGGVLHWIWNVPGSQARCGLCDRDSNRCSNVTATLKTRVLTAPYDQMQEVTDTAQFTGILLSGPAGLATPPCRAMAPPGRSRQTPCFYPSVHAWPTTRNC
jgi:hypothetical protein